MYLCPFLLSDQAVTLPALIKCNFHTVSFSSRRYCTPDSSVCGLDLFIAFDFWTVREHTNSKTVLCLCDLFNKFRFRQVAKNVQSRQI